MEKNVFVASVEGASSRKKSAAQESDRVQQFELGYEHAMIAYNEGMHLREKLMEIAENDADFCYDVLMDVYRTFFADLDAEERSRHIMHRIVLGTMINEIEKDVIIFDREHDQRIFDQFFVPASRAKSKEEIRSIADSLMQKEGNGYIVQ